MDLCLDSYLTENYHRIDYSSMDFMDTISSYHLDSDNIIVQYPLIIKQSSVFVEKF